MPKAAQYNRLAQEKSPYLLQHSTNPIDWYPWSHEAFKKALNEDKPIFLSIGYSTCHWCHVMERESFEDKGIATILNRHFVSIKVDREERPDIDNIYMKVSLLATGSGGWPLTIIMTPEKHPFFAGSYLPKHSKTGRLGLMNLLENIADLWEKDRANLTSAAGRIMEYLERQSEAKSHEANFTLSTSETSLDEAFLALLDSFDQLNGGFGTHPKFPSPHNLLFLLRYWKRRSRQQALHMVEKTLTQMRMGGVFDQVGFGFHRYATDAQWLVPHFEKMLYDQALMAMTYVEAYQATGKEEYRKTTLEIFEYLLRDMVSSEGGFYTAEDADSEGQEGKFYLWALADINKVLGSAAGQVNAAYSVQKDGNYRDEILGRTTGKNILHLKRPLSELSTELGLKLPDLEHNLELARQKLFAARRKRIAPMKDRKILTDWNGLTIAALARTAQVLDSETHRRAATHAADFILRNLKTSEGRLLHVYADDEAAIPGTLDDYAFYGWGLIELYEATYQLKYLREALNLLDTLNTHFWDDAAGGFYFTPDDGEKLILRGKQFHDGAIPSGNSVTLLNLVKLARMTGNTAYEERAQALANSFASHATHILQANTMFQVALDLMTGPSYEIVVVGSPDSQRTRHILKRLAQTYNPYKTILFRNEDDNSLDDVAPFTKQMKTIKKKPTIYICKNFICYEPTADLSIALKTLKDCRSP